MPDYVNVIEVNDTDGSFIQIAQRFLMEKETFEKDSNIFPGIAGLGVNISMSEEKYLFLEISKRIKSGEIDSEELNKSLLSKDVILEKINEIGNQEEIGIFVSLGLKYDVLLQRKIIKFDNELNSFILDVDDRKIKIYPIRDSKDENKILIIRKDSINWRYKKTSDNERLEVIIREYEKDKSKADVIARSISKLDFINLTKIKEIKLKDNLLS
jgi:hypothetical protein